MVESLDCDNVKHRKITTISAIKMLGTPYLCAFYVATAGLQGASLGSDEEEIVLLIYVIIDMTQNQVSRLLIMVVKGIATNGGFNMQYTKYVLQVAN